MISGMTPGLILTFLVAGLLALLPVWRLRVAGWSPGALLTAWLVYGVGILLAVRFAAGFRFLLPILVLAYLAPFVAGPERLSRVLGARRPKPRVVIDVTPSPKPALPPPPKDVTPDPGDEPGQGDEPGPEPGQGDEHDRPGGGPGSGAPG